MLEVVCGEYHYRSVAIPYPCMVSVSLGVFYKEKHPLINSLSKTSRMQQSLKPQEKIPWEGEASK